MPHICCSASVKCRLAGGDHYRQFLEFLRTDCGLIEINSGSLGERVVSTVNRSSRGGPHVGSQDVVGVAVELGPDAVISHRRSRV